MATVSNSITLAFSTTLTLNETEVRALEALVGYGDDAFLKFFGEKLGTHYMRDYENGLRSAFGAIRQSAIPAIAHIDQVRRDLASAAQKRKNDELERAKL